MGMCYSCLVFQPQIPEYTISPSDSSAPCYVHYPTLHLDQQGQEPTRQFDCRAEGVWLSTSKGSKIPAGWIEKKGAQYTILFSHGNAECLGQSMGYGKELSRVLGVNFFAYEYTGYGLSQGGPCSEKGTYADIRAALDWLVEVKRVRTQQIIIMGRSLGSGPTIWLASRKDVRFAGVILVAGFTSIVRVVFPQAKIPYFIDMYRNLERVKRIACPILAVHGTDDEIIPISHAEDLVKAARNTTVPPFWIKGFGHNTAELSDWRKTFKIYEKFLRSISEAQEGQSRSRADAVPS